MDLGEICLACGMCCSGVLYTEARLAEDERQVMIRIGGRLTPDRTAFTLPCPVHDGERCTSYECRPRVCHDFECEVLMSVRSGERSADEARQLIASLKQKVAEAEKHVGGPETGLTLNERIGSFLRQTPRDDGRYNEIMLKAIVLDIERAPFETRSYEDPRQSGPALDRTRGWS